MIKTMEITTENTTTEPILCSSLCAMAERGDIRDDFFLQREAEQWSNEDRDNFIVTVLLNEKFNPLIICEEYTSYGIMLWIIDGLQRFTYLRKFKAGGFKIGNNIEPEEVIYQEAKKDENGAFVKDEYGNPVYEKVTFSLKNKGYEDLPKVLQERFDNCAVPITKHFKCDREQIARHLRRYNRGTKMRPAQILLTRMAQIGNHIKNLAEHDFWSDKANYSPTFHKNGRINQIIAENIMALNFWDDWTKNAKKMGQYLDGKATDEMFEEMKNLLDQLMDITTMEVAEELFAPKNAFIWMKFFKDSLENNITKETFGEFLKNFDDYSGIDVEVTYNNEIFDTTWSEFDESKNTKDRGVINAKLHILHTLINKFMTDNGIEITHQDEENTDNVEVTDDMTEIPESQKTNETEDVVVPEENTVVEDESNANKTEDVAIIDDPQESIPEDELVEFVNQNTDLNVDAEDIALYKDMVEDSIHITSPLYQKCYKALIALMAEACETEMDDEFSEWIHKHENEDNNYSNNQRVNYLYFKRDFDRAVSAIG